MNLALLLFALALAETPATSEPTKVATSNVLRCHCYIAITKYEEERNVLGRRLAMLVKLDSRDETRTVVRGEDIAKVQAEIARLDVGIATERDKLEKLEVQMLTTLPFTDPLPKIDGVFCRELLLDPDPKLPVWYVPPHVDQ